MKCLTGCDRADVRAPLKKDGTMGDGYMIDVHALNILKKRKVVPNDVQEPQEKPNRRVGGPPTKSF